MSERASIAVAGGSAHVRRQQARRSQDHLGLPLVTCGRDGRASLAPPAKWREFEAADRVLTPDHLRRLAVWAQGTAAVPNGVPDQPAPLPARMLELQFAQIIGAFAVDRGSFWDVVLPPRGSRPGIGWEVHLLQHGRIDDFTVVSNMDVVRVPSAAGASLGRRVEELFSVLEDDRLRAAEEQNVGDSRVAYFYVERTGRALRVWEEPYYPGTELAKALEWRLSGDRVVGDHDGEDVWEWYPRRGQLRHKVVPPQEANLIAMPTRAIDPVTWQEAIGTALLHSGLDMELAQRQRELAGGGAA